MSRRLGYVVAAAAALLLALLGYAATRDLQPVPDSPSLRVFRGAVHVHTNASHDGKQSLERVVHDTHAAGLEFVVITEHNTQRAGAEYADNGVLVVNAVELSRPDGHSLAFELSPEQVAQAKDADAVTLRRMSPLLVAAHPDSRKHPMRDEALLGHHAAEVLSTSSDFYALGARAPWLLAYPLNPALALAALYPERSAGIERFDAMAQSEAGRALRLACGVDDHGWIGAPARLTSYVTYLPTFIPMRSAADDARALAAHLAAGESYCALGLLGDASPLSFTVRGLTGVATFGATVAVPAVLKARFAGPLPPGHTFYVYVDGALKLRSTDAAIELALSEPGRYRLEVGRDVPTLFGARHVRWIYGNPVTVTPSVAVR